jgi:hypothetical protein
MRPVVLILVLLLGSRALVAQAASAARPCDADALHRLICSVDDSVGAALVRADTFMLSRLYADDVVTINYRGVRLTKPTLLAAIGRGSLEFDTLLVRQRSVRVQVDIAVVEGRTHQVARGPEGPHPLEVRYRRTYVRRLDRWLLVETRISADGTQR